MQQQAPQFMPPPPAAAPGQPQVPVWQQQSEQGGPPEVRKFIEVHWSPLKSIEVQMVSLVSLDTCMTCTVCMLYTWVYTWFTWFPENNFVGQAAVAKPVQRGPAGPALDVKSGLSLEVVTGKALQEMPHFVDISLSFFAVQDVKGMKGNVVWLFWPCRWKRLPSGSQVLMMERLKLTHR